MRSLVLIPALLALTACGAPDGTASPNAEPATAPQSDHSACVAKGIAYFQAIESYPKLSDGRDAARVASDRCGRTTGAFDNLSY